MRMQPISVCLAACITLLRMQAVAAEEQPLKFSGYGTLGITSMSSDQGDFKGSFADVPNGVGRSNNLSAAPDSRLALQADLNITDQLEAVAQVMARHTRFNDYAPSFELLNLKYNFSTRTSVRFGRIAHPFFMASDTRQIGYAQTYIRGPFEVYGQSDITNSDVIQLSHRQPLAISSVLMTAGFGQARYGNPPSDTSVANEDAGTLKQMGFADALWEIGALQVRLGYTSGINDLSINRLNDLYKVASVINTSLADELGFSGKKVSFTGIGFIYDPGPYLVQGEYTMTRWALGSKSIVANANAYYLMGGWRQNVLTTYGIYSRRVTDAPRVVQEFPSPQINTAFDAVAASSAPAQHTVSAGLRYDLRPGVALKLQIDSVTQDGATGYLTNLSSLNPPQKDSQYSVIGLNLDFIF